MKNSELISDVCGRISESCLNITGLCVGSQKYAYASPEMSEMYQGMALDELEHIQALTLELTEMLADEVETEPEESEIYGEVDGADEGSVFAAGDLDHVKGEVKTEDEPGVAE